MDVFGTSTAAPIVFAADRASLSFETGGPALAQGVEITFSRNVTPVPLLNGVKALSIGVPQGQLTARLVVADRDSLSGLQLDKECGLGTITVRCANGVCNQGDYAVNGASEITLHGCIASAAQITISAEQGMVIGNFTVTFTGMTM